MCALLDALRGSLALDATQLATILAKIMPSKAPRKITAKSVAKARTAATSAHEKHGSAKDTTSGVWELATVIADHNRKAESGEQVCSVQQTSVSQRQFVLIGSHAIHKRSHSVASAGFSGRVGCVVEHTSDAHDYLPRFGHANASLL